MNGKKPGIVIDDMLWVEPDSCKHCDWEPAVVNNPDQEIAVDNIWLVIPLPNSTVWFYICPKCSTVWANKNAVENVKRLKKAQESKILTFDSDKPISEARIKLN